MLVLVISLGATFGMWRFETNRATELNALQFARSSLEVDADLRATMQAYGQFLRGGVALYHASEEVSRDEWARYVSELSFAGTYPGIQGLSYNPVLENGEERANFVQMIRETDLADFKTFPETDLPLSVPVLYIGPLTELNARAVGFDIYSEERRRNAINAAIETGEPRITAKITLLQDGDPTDLNDERSAVLMILPVFDVDPVPETVEARIAATTGVIVSVFRIRDLMETVIGRHDESFTSNTQFTLYDAASADPEAIVYRAFAEDAVALGQFSSVEQFEVFGRTWSLYSKSTRDYDDIVKSRSPGIIATAGVMLSILLTALVIAQSRQSRISEQAAIQSRRDQDRIRTLLKEVSHRSKNMLAVVRVIARQTAVAHPDDFLPRFSKRIESLAASQDLLVRSDWAGAKMADLIASQISHLSPNSGLRLQIDGPPIDLGPTASQTIGMAIHELSTNAVKYGALSNDQGRVSLKWGTKSEGDAQQFFVSWIESGGPQVKVSARKGFGAVMLDRITRGNLSADVEYAFEPEGVQWHLTCPLDLTAN